MIETRHGARLVICRGSTPRTAFDHGVKSPVSLDTVRLFLERLSAAEIAWAADAIPAGVSDGITLTAEQATAHDYRRVRMIEPPEGSPHRPAAGGVAGDVSRGGARADVRGSSCSN